LTTGHLDRYLTRLPHDLERPEKSRVYPAWPMCLN
jgi:hypothetical protein